jgi:hypothetical protein
MKFYPFTFIVLQFIMLFSVKTSNSEDKDPFASLGIPELDSKAILDSLDSNTSQKNNKKQLPKLRSIDDLPNFLKNSNLNEDEGINILTRFLIQDDYTLKKFGVVFDQTGFDGLGTTEPIAPVGSEERLSQRARSAANIYVNKF